MKDKDSKLLEEAYDQVNEKIKLKSEKPSEWSGRHSYIYADPEEQPKDIPPDASILQKLQHKLKKLGVNFNNWFGGWIKGDDPDNPAFADKPQQCPKPGCGGTADDIWFGGRGTWYCNKHKDFISLPPIAQTPGKTPEWGITGKRIDDPAYTTSYRKKK